MEYSEGEKVMIYQFFDLLSTVLESTLIVDTLTQVAEPKHKGRKQIGVEILAIFIMTGIVTIMNQIQLFSILTLVIGAIGYVGLSKIFTKGKLMLRTLGCILIFFLLHTMDSIVGFTLALFVKKSPNVYQSFILIMQPGLMRILYTVINKTIQIILCACLRQSMRKIKELNRSTHIMMIGAFLVGYIAVVILANLIVTDSLFTIQISVILSWMFIFIAMIVGLVGLVLSNQYYNIKRDVQLLEVTNEMLERNYVQLSNNQMMISRQVHDFNHHLKTLQGLYGSKEDAKKYIDELCAAPYEGVQFCQSGNKVVDAIINCKKVEAEEKEIAFSFQVDSLDEITIKAIDICAVLSNQIDNALEACHEVTVNERFIDVSIRLKNDFMFLIVKNSVNENPFDENGRLRSKKRQDTQLHGLGVKNISETAKRYNGNLKNEYENQVFTSYVMIQNM